MFKRKGATTCMFTFLSLFSMHFHEEEILDERGEISGRKHTHKLAEGPLGQDHYGITLAASTSMDQSLIRRSRDIIRSLDACEQVKLSIPEFLLIVIPL